MKVLIAGAFAFAIFAASSTANAATEEKWFVTVDTVGNCSVSQGKPSAGQTALGETGGYDTEDAAGMKLEEIREDSATCKGVVE